MKYIITLAALVLFPFLSYAEDRVDKAYAFCAMYAFEDGGLRVWPYMYEGLWVKGKKTEDSFVLKADDSFVDLSDNTYEEYRLERLTTDNAYFLKRVYSYSRGPSDGQRQAIIKGKLLTSSAFTLPNKFNGLLIDYYIWVEGDPKGKHWKSR